MKKFLKPALVVFLSGAIFFISSYLYLNSSLKSAEQQADKKAENIPFRQIPENCGLLTTLPNGKSMLFYLDFESEILYIINVYSHFENTNDYVGYPIDKKCNLDYYSLSLIIDRIGGIDIEGDGGFLRYGGIQVCDMISGDNSDELFYTLLDSFCEKIAQVGFFEDDFSYLISVCDTNLTMPICLYWSDYMSDMFSNVVFVNREEPQ